MHYLSKGHNKAQAKTEGVSEANSGAEVSEQWLPDNLVTNPGTDESAEDVEALADLGDQFSFVKSKVLDKICSQDDMTQTVELKDKKVPICVVCMAPTMLYSCKFLVGMRWKAEDLTTDISDKFAMCVPFQDSFRTITRCVDMLSSQQAKLVLNFKQDMWKAFNKSLMELIQHSLDECTSIVK